MIPQEIPDEQATGFYGFKAMLDANQVDYSSLRPELCRVTANFVGKYDKSFKKCWLEEESNLLIREFKHKKFLETVEAETGIKRQELRTNNNGSEKTNDPSIRTKDQSYIKNWQKNEGLIEFALATYYWFHAFCPDLKYTDQIDQQLLKNQPEKQKKKIEKLVKIKKRICKDQGQTAIFYIPQKISDVPSEQPVFDKQNDETTSVENSEKLPPIIRYKSPPLDDNNPFHEEHVPYIGREAEFDQLNAFTEHADKFKVWAISGSSGAGKTRLACKWLLESEKLSGWDQIILEPKSKKHTKSSYWKKKWKLQRNTVLVIDYLYGFRKVLHTLFEHFRDLQKSKTLKHTVRILLIDHVFPEKLEDLRRDSRLQFYTMSDREMQNYRQLLFETYPLNLQKTEDQDEIIPKIIRNAAGSDVTEESIISAIRFLDDIQGAWHPLFALLIGDALKKAPKGSPPDFTTWNRRELIKCYLSGDQRLPWMQDKLSPVWASACVAAATAMNGIDFRRLTSCIPNSDDNPIADFPEIKDICRSIISIPDIRQDLLAFKSDMLGESFFLLFVKALQEGSINLRPVRKPFIAMLSVGSKQAQSDDDTQFIGFITRLTRNLCNDD